MLKDKSINNEGHPCKRCIVRSTCKMNIPLKIHNGSIGSTGENSFIADMNSECEEYVNHLIKLHNLGALTIKGGYKIKVSDYLNDIHSNRKE